MKIKLEYESLDELVKALGHQEESFMICVSEMNQLINSIPESWEGNAAQAYESQFNELQPSFEATRQLIAGMQSQIMETMRLMQEKDEELANKLSF